MRTKSTWVLALIFAAPPTLAQTPMPVGSEFLVNTYTMDRQLDAAVVVAAAGDFVVVWRSLGSDNGDTSSWSVQGQRFQVPIFADGFESGDTTAWSSTVP